MNPEEQKIPDGAQIPQVSTELLCDQCDARIYFHPVTQLWHCSNPYCQHSEKTVTA